MVLDGIAHHPDFLVETQPLVYPVGFIKNNLDRFDGPVVPNPADDVVVEPHEQQVLHELLAKVVVDTENFLVGERFL